jgi:uncharacterized protein
MTAALTYPGVYIREIPSGVHPIVGVATSITAFIGRARRGPTDRPVRIQSFADFERTFGGLWQPATLGYAVQQFYANGGTDALIVRVARNAAKATLNVGNFGLKASSEGDWGEQLRVRIDHVTRDPLDTTLFNLLVRDDATGEVERFLNLSTDPGNARFVKRTLELESRLVRVVDPVSATPPDGKRYAYLSGCRSLRYQHVYPFQPGRRGWLGHYGG